MACSQLEHRWDLRCAHVHRVWAAWVETAALGGIGQVRAESLQGSLYPTGHRSSAASESEPCVYG